MSDRKFASFESVVVLDVDLNAGYFEMVLTNVGGGVAHDIKVDFSRKIIGAEGVVITELPVFQRLRTLRPRKELRIYVDTAIDLFERRKLNAFGATIRWRDTTGSERKATYRHDLDIYRDLPQIITGAGNP